MIEIVRDGRYDTVMRVVKCLHTMGITTNWIPTVCSASTWYTCHVFIMSRWPTAAEFHEIETTTGMLVDDLLGEDEDYGFITDASGEEGVSFNKERCTVRWIA